MADANDAEAARTTVDRRLTIADCRREVIAFAVEMERKLRQHDGTKGEDAWKGDEPDMLAARAIEEARELHDASLAFAVERQRTREHYDAVMGEAADVGNMAMMAADAAGALPWVALLATKEAPVADAKQAERHLTIDDEHFSHHERDGEGYWTDFTIYTARQTFLEVNATSPRVDGTKGHDYTIIDLTREDAQALVDWLVARLDEDSDRTLPPVRIREGRKLRRVAPGDPVAQPAQRDNDDDTARDDLRREGEGG